MENLKDLAYEELCSLFREGGITLLQWIGAQDEMQQAFEEWCSMTGVQPDEENAKAFIREYEDMDGFPAVVQQDIMASVEKYRKTMADFSR